MGHQINHVPWTVLFIVILLGASVKCDSTDNETRSPLLYQRKYVIRIPEPLVCFPGFDDKVLELQNTTILKDIYNLKVVKLYDFVPLLTSMGAPIFIGTSILKVLLRYADKEYFSDFSHDIVDAKIDASIARTEIARLRAKIDTIYNRMSTVMDDQYPEDVKKAELIVAVDKSEEILNMFRDRDFIFKRYPAASMPFIVLFYGPCKILLQVAGILVPSKKTVYENQLAMLRETVDDYKRITMNGRIDGLLLDKVKDYPDPKTWTKNLWNHQVWSYDYDIRLLDSYGGWGPCHKVQKFETYNETESELIQGQQLEEYVTDLKSKYDAFFESPIEVFKHQTCMKTCPQTGTSSAASVSSSFRVILTLLPVFFFQFCRGQSDEHLNGEHFDGFLSF